MIGRQSPALELQNQCRYALMVRAFLWLSSPTSKQIPSDESVVEGSEESSFNVVIIVLTCVRGRLGLCLCHLDLVDPFCAENYERERDLS
jgi:hypothetical protein